MKNKKGLPRREAGQALISLLFFIIIAMFLISAAVVMLIVSAQSTGESEGSEIASRVAEAAAEDAILKYLRDPTFTSENLTLPNGTASATIAGGIITVNAVSGKFVKKLVVGTTLTNNVFSVNYWKESY